ncbi:MAG TPA: hypothetical protein VFX70_22590, partial [Mycobacteriales bacterium]|nr:hypothetical protein [Mycobacteriales bacterium]
GWDLYAIGRHQWSFRTEWISGVVLPGGLPVEEALFFVVVPTCAILAFEAVRAVKGWPAGDEPDPTGPADPTGRADSARPTGTARDGGGR